MSDVETSVELEAEYGANGGQAAEEEIAPSTADLALETKKFVLQSLLEKAQSVLPSRDVLPVLKNFQIEAEPGRVRVVATDLELSVVATSEMVVVKRSGLAVFPGARLVELAKEAEGGELIMDVREGTANIAVARTVWELKLMDGSEYPPLPDTEDIDLHAVSRSKFLGAIGAVRYAAATETTRPSLMMLDVSGGKIRAADGVRFQQLDISEWWPADFDVQIPINAVDDLVRLLGTTELDQLEIGESENHLVFRLGSDTFLATKLVAEFPDVDGMLLKPSLANEERLNVDRQEMISAIKRVRVTADPETSAVVLALDENQMTVRSQDKFGNTATETLDVAWRDPAREVAFNSDHLLDMLNMADAKSCAFFLGKDTKQRKSPILLKDEEAGHLGVLNQIRIDFLS